MKSFIAVLMWVALTAPALADEAAKGDFWDRTKVGAKRMAKGIKKGGKEIGRGFQEIFDPNDEDLQAERKEKKKEEKKDKDD